MPQQEFPNLWPLAEIDLGDCQLEYRTEQGLVFKQSLVRHVSKDFTGNAALCSVGWPSIL